MKKTINEKLKHRKYKKPNALMYRLLYCIVPLVFGKYKVKVTRKLDLKKYKHQQFILIGNHASRADYIFASLACGPGIRLNYLTGHQEFYRKHLQGIFSLVKNVPKKQYIVDLVGHKGIKKVLADGGNICFFPEGHSSISGAQQPVVVGTGAFLKHLNLPVLKLKIRGGYLTNSKFDVNERCGACETEISELLLPEQMQKLSGAEIDEIIDRELYHDDFEWNKQVQVSFKNGGKPAKHLEQLMYVCPVCGQEFCMESTAHHINCTKCGFSVTVDDKFNLTAPSGTFMPSTPSKWVDWERRLMRKEVQNPDFSYSEPVRLGMLPKYDYVPKQEHSQEVGHGILTIDRTGLTYKGTKNGEQVTLHLDSKDIFTMVMPNDTSYLFTWAFGEFYDFEPTNHICGLKLTLAVEEVHRVNGGIWQNYKWFDYDDINEGWVKFE